ncbi:MAG: transketolase [Bacteroidia bacterium]|nr:transketolase [Bacteroidia bacterium]MDW8159695.1 transketolase [Bacteroidia bacterium]
MEFSIEDLTIICKQIRRDIIRMVYIAQSGHPGGSLGCVELFVALYYRILAATPESFTPSGIGEDVFILSNGHITPVFYSVLARRGYFPIAELATFRKINSRLQGHPSPAKGLPGIRIATGSLGQGLSVAIGNALAKRLHGDPHLVYVLIGDGEAQEGQVWEAANFAQHHQVDNLITLLDLNFKQIDGDTRTVMNTHSLAQKWRAFNWEVLEIFNPYDWQELLTGLEKAKSLTQKRKPIIVLLYTTLGKGVDFMENDHNWHGKAPNTIEFEKALSQLPATMEDF